MHFSLALLALGPVLVLSAPINPGALTNRYVDSAGKRVGAGTDAFPSWLVKRKDEAATNGVSPSMLKPWMPWKRENGVSANAFPFRLAKREDEAATDGIGLRT